MGRKNPAGEASLKLRERRSLGELRQRGIYLLPNLFTTGNLFCGVYATLSVFQGHHVRAVAAILIATVFDMMDGMLARMTKTTSRFGLEYDSLSDLVSFGIAPGLVAYAWGLSGYGRLGWAACFLYVACGALRLARYNVLSAASNTQGFLGLPIPGAAAFVAALIVLDDYILHMGKTIRPILVLGMTYMLAFLMVSTFRYRSVKEMGLGSRSHFGGLVAVVLILLVFMVEPQITFFVLISLYIVSGVLEKPIMLLYRYFHKNSPRSSVVEERS